MQLLQSWARIWTIRSDRTLLSDGAKWFLSLALPQQHRAEPAQLLRRCLQCSCRMQLQHAQECVTAFICLAQAGKHQQGTSETNHCIPAGARDIFYSGPWALSCLEGRQLQGCCISSISPLNTTLNFEEQWQSSTALTLRHFSFEMHFALAALAREAAEGGMMLHTKRDLSVTELGSI